MISAQGELIINRRISASINLPYVNWEFNLFQLFNVFNLPLQRTKTAVYKFSGKLYARSLFKRCTELWRIFCPNVFGFNAIVTKPFRGSLTFKENRFQWKICHLTKLLGINFHSYKKYAKLISEKPLKQKLTRKLFRKNCSNRTSHQFDFSGQFKNSILWKARRSASHLVMLDDCVQERIYETERKS